MDRTLIERLRRSDRSAFAEIYRQTSGKVFTTVRKVLASEDLAKDVVQDLYVKIWENRESIDPEKSFESYIFVIARNLSYHYYDEAVKALVRSVDIEVAETIAGGQESDNPEVKSLEEYLVKIVETQPEMRRKVFMMSRFEQLSNAEIAKQLNISERTVEAHIYQVLRVLKQAIGYIAILLIAGEF